MRILFSNQLLLLGAVVLTAWLLVRFVLIPRAQLAVADAKSGQVVKLGGHFGFLLTLRSLLDAMLIAGVLVASFAAALQWYIAGYSDTPSAIAKVVKLRDTVERAIDSLSWLSGEAWVVSLAALASIWLIASRSASRRSWDSALNARRSALSAEVADLTGDDLLVRANTLDVTGVAEIERKAQSIISDNASRVKDLQSKPILKMGDDPQRVASLKDLRNFEQLMRTRAASDEATDMDQEQRTESADGVLEKIKEIESQVMLPLRTLDGTRDVSLAQALADPEAAIHLKEKREILLRHLVVEAQLSNHASLGVKKLRREPELIREWLGAVPTGVAAVRAAFLVGRSAALACLVLLFVGFVSLGVIGLGPVLVSQASALELKLTAQGADSDLSAAVQQEIPPAPPSNAELASDNATVDFLRQSFRVPIARRLQADFVHVSARERFAFAAVEARQRLLLASARQAATTLEPGQARHAYRFSESVHASVTENPVAVLDEALDRRIKTLRANERLWVQLRMVAARPAPADLAAEAFLKTALLTGDIGRTHTFNVWAERASQDFATQTARLGHPPSADYHVPSFSDEHLISARDRRLVGDYRAQVPQHVTQTMAGVRDGSLDPGSLHRELPGAVGRQSVYSELFPASSTSGGSSGGFSGGGGGGGGGGFSGGGGGGTKGASPRTHVASTPPARSYAKVRFSGKVGGVLIGINPQPGGDEIDLRGFMAQIESNRLSLTLTDNTGQQVKLGPYHPAVAHHALAYAADGRVVTSTLPQPQVSRNDEIKLDARRVVVHPAFEDTAFACPAIQVDRFVDGFTNRDQPGESIDRVNTVRLAVTALGMLVPQTWENASAPVSDRIRQLTQIVAKHAQTCGVGSNCFPIEDYKNYGLDFGGTPDFLACLARKEEPGSCLGALRRGREAAVTYLVDSGVREGPFVLDKKLLFLTGANRINDPLWPLDFMIQAVPQPLTDDGVEIRDAWEPWRFTTIDGLIKEAVAKGVATDPNARAVLATMRDFTILQRLFRLALAGELGLSFPLEELVKLQQATAASVRIERSERWNVNDSLLQTLASEHARLKTMLNQVISHENVPETCRATADKAIQGNNDWPGTEGLWPSVGQVEKACQGSSVASPLVRRLALLRRHDLVDEAIRWGQSYQTLSTPFACSPL